MDGKNSVGRKVSLLIDDSPAQDYTRLPPSRSLSAASNRSRASSCASLKSTPSLYKKRGTYPPVLEASNIMSPPLPITTSTRLVCSVNPSTPESSGQPNVSTLPTKPALRKNTYPCPLAEAFDCSDRFTTSGHAARHARKHIGKKDAFCPECNRAFTRRDNMEQHRRTHQKVYGPIKAATESNKIENLTKSSSRKSNKPLPPSSGVAALAQVKEQQQQQQQPQRHMTLERMMSPGPFINPDPIQALSQPISVDLYARPLLHYSGYTNQLDCIPPTVSMTFSNPAPCSDLDRSPRLAPQSADTSLCKQSGSFYSHSLRPPSADKCKHDRQHSELPMLPHFHPANFPTPQHGSAPTISPGIGRKQAQLGSQSRHKQIVEAQKRLNTYQYEVLDFNEGQGRKSLLKAEPSSPKLQPTTLSGPVTPLALEEHET